MVTNVFFNNYGSTAEQTLIEDLIIESIRIYGHDVYYCPRTITYKDEVFNQGDISEYKKAYQIEMYVRNTEGFEGEEDILSKFGVQIRNELTLTVAVRVFGDEIAAYQGTTRPLEGDLIYLPFSGDLFQIRFVEHESIFYQMGSLQIYDLRCEMFEYSNEKLNTGIAEIDAIETKHTTDVGELGEADTYANGDIIIDPDTGRPQNISNDYDMGGDPFADNSTYQSETPGFIDFSEIDPFSEGNI